MTIGLVHTAQGMIANKSADLVITIASITLQPGELILGGLTYDVGAGAPVVAWGNRRCKPLKTISGNGVITRAVGTIYDGSSARTRNLVATWTTTAPTAKTMIGASWIADVSFGIVDVTDSQSEASTTSPNSGTGTTVTFPDEALWGIFGAEGPNSDTLGTVQNGWTSGQTTGTSGAGAASNITGHEAYKIITAIEDAQALKTGATSRDFSTVMVALRAIDMHSQGISPTDIREGREIFEAAGLDTKDTGFQHNDELDRMELYDMTGPTLVAYFDRSLGWTTV